MHEVLAGTIIISLLHALIPSHWMPLVSFARLQKWTEKETLKVSFYLALSHVFSTLLLGLILGLLFYQMRSGFGWIFQWLGPGLLIISGIYFIYRHHTHHHFHIDDHMLDQTRTRKQIIYALMAYMFLAPCLEVEAYFVNAGLHSTWLLVTCLLCYFFISITGMICWVYIALKGFQKFDTHKLEHNAGIITGLTMVITGLLSILMDHA